jgi:nucleotide-binding universal stress UspA family protein
MSPSTILVTCDFTEVSAFALEHAVRIAKMVGNSIQIIHILSKKHEEENTLKELQIICEDCFAKHGIKPGIIVKEGTIFTTISEVANNIQANLVIMGTHGIKGMQKLTGSWALKVIVGSSVPFVVVQAPPKHNYLQKIVVPINFKSENKEKLPWIIYLAQYYRSEILIFRDQINDERIATKVNQNILFLKKALENKGIRYSVNTNDTKLDFADATIEFTQKNQADLIAVMTTKNIGLKDYVVGASEQQIIANNFKIPVMCINPREELYKYGGFN